MPGEKDWVYVTCACGSRIVEPFQRYSGPVVHTHYRRGGRNRGHGRGCRVLVIPDPKGDAHKVIAIPDDMSFEQAITWGVQEYPPPRTTVAA